MPSNEYFTPEFEIGWINYSVKRYISKYVNVTITEPIPDVPQYIGAEEEFTFDVIVSNMAIPFGGQIPYPDHAVRLHRVAYHIWVQNDDVIQLKVPDRPLYARDGYPSGGRLESGSFVREMYITPYYQEYEKSILDKHETDTIKGLRGKGLTLDQDQTTKIFANIVASVDVNDLFAPNTKGRTTSKTVLVRGT